MEELKIIEKSHIMEAKSKAIHLKPGCFLIPNIQFIETYGLDKLNKIQNIQLNVRNYINITI